MNPTFIGIGAQKAGTTWLFANVFQHPDVAGGPKKEIHFFDRPDTYARGLEWYGTQFGERKATAIGECTPAYLWTVGDPAVAETEGHMLGTALRVAKACPDARLVVILRHPVDRAVSAVRHDTWYRHLRAGTSLMEAIERRPGIRARGHYADHFEEWFRHFGRDQFLVLIYEEDIRPREVQPATLRRVFEHIGVDPGFVPETLSDRRNKSASPFTLRQRTASQVGRAVLGLVPQGLRSHRIWDLPRDAVGERVLWEEYEPEVRRLEEILCRRLPWNEPTA